MTLREWQKAALARLRVVHTPSGTAGNLAGVMRGTATIFVGYETFGIGNAKLPKFKKFPLAEVKPESEVQP